MPLILKNVDGALGTITLNNPEKRNCLSAALIREVCSALDEFEASSVRVVILRAQPGVNVWSAGYDVNELPHPGRDPLPYAAPFGRLLRRVQRFPGPVIAMIEGGVWGGACDLVLTCDILIGSETTSFTVTPAKIGIPYTASGMIHQRNGLEQSKGDVLHSRTNLRNRRTERRNTEPPCTIHQPRTVHTRHSTEDPSKRPSRS